MIKIFNNLLKTRNIFFNDFVHTSISVSVLAKAIIDTTEFQRLRELHQLGVSHYVFPNANHTRFEHSIGVYHLVGTMLQNLVNNSTLIEINKALLEIPFTKKYLIKYHDLQMDSEEESVEFLRNSRISLLDTYLMENIKIAGLVHDLGHCAFSHMFDSWLHKKYGTEFAQQDINVCEHEARSILLFKQIVLNYSVDINGTNIPISDFIDDESFNFIAELINPTTQSPTNYIYQIVSNSVNGLDVDKLDYLKRDSYYLGVDIPFKLNDILSHVKIINGNICYPREKAYKVFEVYNARYVLHKEYYNHSTTKLIEFMMRDILDFLDPVLGIYESFKSRNLNKIASFTDVLIISSCNILKMFNSVYIEHKNNIDGAERILNNINNRKLYKKLYYHTLKISEPFNHAEFLTNFDIEHLNQTSINPENNFKINSDIDMQHDNLKSDLKKAVCSDETVHLKKASNEISLMDNIINDEIVENTLTHSFIHAHTHAHTHAHAHALTQTDTTFNKFSFDKINHEKIKIGLLNGNDTTHPIEKVHFYDSHNNCVNLKIKQISNLISSDYQEIIHVGFYKT